MNESYTGLNESCDSPLLVVQKRRRKKQKKKSAFIDDEAALSEDDNDVSGDESEDGDHMDALEASFVDDATQKGNETMYLKSLRSPAAAARGHAGLQQRRPLRPITADLFSQVKVFLNFLITNTLELCGNHNRRIKCSSIKVVQTSLITWWFPSPNLKN